MAKRTKEEREEMSMNDKVAKRPRGKAWLSIPVCGYSIPVYLKADLRCPEGTRVYGLWTEDHESTRGFIMLDRGMSPDVMWETLIHEVLHAVSDFYGLNLSEDKVTKGAMGLHQAFASYLVDLPRIPGAKRSQVAPPALRIRKKRAKSKKRG